jgi:hypothetical protein
MEQPKYLKVLDQIRKLLALASNNTNEHEAALALLKAKEIMLKYNIDNIDLEKDSKEDIIEVDFKISHSSEEYTLRFVYWLGKAFLVKPILIKRNIGNDKIKFEKYIRFIGKTPDVAVSTFVFSYMMNILDQKSKEYSTKLKKRKDYDLGFVTAVCDKLKKMEDERIIGQTFYEDHPENALIISSNALINQYIKEKYDDKLNEGKKLDIEFNPDNYMAGYLEGGKHGIFAGIVAPDMDPNSLGGIHPVFSLKYKK